MLQSKKIKDLTLGEVRKICDSICGVNCELYCPIIDLCAIADNDIKKVLEKEVEYEIRK